MAEIKLTNKKIDELIGVTESFHASYKLMGIIQDKTKRENLFDEFLKMESDLTFDWFTDYFQSEHSDRKGKMQDFTPDGVVAVCNRILGETTSNADVCAGTGGLTIKRWADNKDALFYCEELSDRALPFLLFNLTIRNIGGYVLHGDSLKKEYKSIYKLTPSGMYSDLNVIENIEEKKVDTVVMNPPYSQAWERVKDERFNAYGLAPKSKADFAFLLHGFSKLSDDGKMVIVLPHGVLYRSGAEETIRTQLLKLNHIDAVIGLPKRLFYNTDIPTVILVLNQKRDNKNVLFIDASEEFKKDKSINSLEDRHINKIIETYQSRKEIERFSHLASFEEIKDNDFNLNIPRYVDTFVPEETKPLNEIMEDMKQIDEMIKKTSQELATMMLELVGTNPEDDKLIKDFASFFAKRHGTRPIEMDHIKKEEVKPIRKGEQLTFYD